MVYVIDESTKGKGTTHSRVIERDGEYASSCHTRQLLVIPFSHIRPSRFGRPSMRHFLCSDPDKVAVEDDGLVATADGNEIR